MTSHPSVGPNHTQNNTFAVCCRPSTEESSQLKVFTRLVLSGPNEKLHTQSCGAEIYLQYSGFWRIILGSSTQKDPDKSLEPPPLPHLRQKNKPAIVSPLPYTSNSQVIRQDVLLTPVFFLTPPPPTLSRVCVCFSHFYFKL